MEWVKGSNRGGSALCFRLIGGRVARGATGRRKKKGTMKKASSGERSVKKKRVGGKG